MKVKTILFSFSTVLASCTGHSYKTDLALFEGKTDFVELTSADGLARIAISPAFQGKVITSSNNGVSGESFGWIDRETVLSSDSLTGGEVGGEDRLWIGPLGSQYSFYFQQIAPLSDSNWKVPATMHNEAYEVRLQTKQRICMEKEMRLTNYIGTKFRLNAQRDIRLLSLREIEKTLGISLQREIKVVGYQSSSSLTNLGEKALTKETGLASIWSLSMLRGSLGSVCYIPLKQEGKTEQIYQYLGKLDQTRLSINNKTLRLKVDGRFRTKIGVPPSLAKNLVASYTPENSTLHIVVFEEHKGDRYFNSTVGHQDNPYDGEVIPIYNHGQSELETGGECSFYELENLAPMEELAPGETTSHWVKIFHLSGTKAELEEVAQRVLGTPL